MSRILNFGSINLDHVYRVPHFVRPGETLASDSYSLGFGGKGYNQSIALARAGAQVWHAGAVGPEGSALLDHLQSEGVDVGGVRRVQVATGHAIIQVDEKGENAIVLFAGANCSIRTEDLEGFFKDFTPRDHFLCQNETSGVAAALRCARERGMSIWFNPAPMSCDVVNFPLDLVDWLVVNETEGAQLSGSSEPEIIAEVLEESYRGMNVILTLGGSGVLARIEGKRYRLPAEKVKVLDTTAAGDTFIGFLAAGIIGGLAAEDALRRAVQAAALCVGKEGAAESIPHLVDLL